MLRGSTSVTTSMDIRSMITTGEIVRLRNQDYTVVAPLTEQLLSLAKPFQLRTSGIGCERGYKMTRAWDGGLTPLTCCVTTQKNSNVIQTDHDLTREVKKGDVVRVRTETFVVSSVVTEHEFTVTPPSRMKSSSMLRAFKQMNCTEIPGTIGVTKGTSMLTTSKDLRTLLMVGDTVEIGTEQYEVVAAPDPMSIVISRDWIEATASRLTMKKCLFPTEESNDGGGVQQQQEGGTMQGGMGGIPGAAVPLSMSMILTSGSLNGLATIASSTVLSDRIMPGDNIRLCGVVYSIQSVVDADKNDAASNEIYRLNRPYQGTTGRCRAWRVPLSRKQTILQSLSARKAQCLSLYCLAKIEEEERTVSFDLESEITRMPSKDWTTLDGQDTMDQLEEEVDKKKKEGEEEGEEEKIEKEEKEEKGTAASPLLSKQSDSVLPLTPAEEERGNGRKSGRSADALQASTGSEDDAMVGEKADLSWFPAEVGDSNVIDDGPSVQDVNAPNKREPHLQVRNTAEGGVQVQRKEKSAKEMQEEEKDEELVGGNDLTTDWVAVLKEQQSGSGPWQGIMPEQ